MWRYFLLTLFFATAVHAAVIIDDENLDHRIIDFVFNDNIRRKCLKVHNDTKIYDDAMHKRDRCYTAQPPGLPTTEKDFLPWVCEMNCMEKFLEEVEDCLSAQEKFLRKLFTGSREEECKNGGRIFKEFSDNMLGYSKTKCEGSSNSMLEYGIGMLCPPKLKFMHHKSEPDFLLTISDVCSDFKTYRDCAVDAVPQICGSNDLAKYVSGFFEAYLNWCELNFSGNEVEGIVLL